MKARLMLALSLALNLATCVAYCGATQADESTYRLTQARGADAYTLDSGLSAADCVQAIAIAAQLETTLTCEKESQP